MQTKYWIAPIDLDVQNKTMTVAAFNISKGKDVLELEKIHVSSIKFAKIVEGTIQNRSNSLKMKIQDDPTRYGSFFNEPQNLGILDYLVECNRLDTAPFKTNFKMIRDIDETVLMNDPFYTLSSTQFEDIVGNLNLSSKDDKKAKITQELCLNVISLYTEKGLYVLAHRRLFLDVEQKRLVPGEEIIVNREFTIDGEVQSIRQFIPEEDMDLLLDVKKNHEEICDLISKYSHKAKLPTDSPFIICLETDINVDLNAQYEGIRNMFGLAAEPLSVPIQAFFGMVKTLPRRIKEYPIILLEKKINLDQLVAIDNAMRYPVTYVQGPPGTGKTSTILNTIITGFFSDKTMLVTSYNNHPMDGVYDKVRKLSYKGSPIPFPAIRLGNNDFTQRALDEIKEMYQRVKDTTILEETLLRKKTSKEVQVKSLSALLDRYEKKLDLLERKETLTKLLDHSDNLALRLQTTQLYELDKELQEIGEVTDQDALSLINQNNEDILQYLYFTSAKFIKRLGEPKYAPLLEILDIGDPDKRISEFNHYIGSEDNLHIFQRVFPIIITTNISAYRLGKPKPCFDITIMDEASQCNISTALIPIIRGQNLLLVGDPQQLNPVISLDPIVNQKLMSKYHIDQPYDYFANSIYKTFISVDPVSEEILLSCHYRCNPQIIAFNNAKFYNNKLKILTEEKPDDPTPLEYIDCPNSGNDGKNTSVLEAKEIIKFVRANPKQNIGIITPFVRQKELLQIAVKEAGLSDQVACGTVHAFQGDEKDIILFSSGITGQTSPKTYEWLKENKELINVAVSRAAKKLVIFTDAKALEGLTKKNEKDDFFELCEYVRTKGKARISSNCSESRALGFKPWSTETEQAFMENLEHALHICNDRCRIQKEVSISQIFGDNEPTNSLFFTGRFDFVVYKKSLLSRKELPIVAIELDGNEHHSDPKTIARDKQKQEICKKKGLQLIRVENSYARRYNHIKGILEEYFKKERN